MLIVFVAAEDDYLLKVIATENVDGKDTHTVSPGSQAEGSGFDSQSGVSCLDSSFPSHICLLLHSQLHCSVSTLPVRVFWLFVPPSQPSNVFATRPWTTPPPTTSCWDPADIRGLAATSRY